MSPEQEQARGSMTYAAWVMTRETCGTAYDDVYAHVLGRLVRDDDDGSRGVQWFWGLGVPGVKTGGAVGGRRWEGGGVRAERRGTLDRRGGDAVTGAGSGGGCVGRGDPLSAWRGWRTRSTALSQGTLCQVGGDGTIVLELGFGLDVSRCELGRLGRLILLR
ncbi:uncharacterized protein A4U43_C02F4660 [Asparagus officinalis]|uniref:Uncharacterized protein n=1 Tax=Asparagus officinalis TaxID=4686 RepID=A0A5P1FGR1_ASPOF|nr:uncharacterized protein A4U43_C02F4660 [Asparagus officinalis]